MSGAAAPPNDTVAHHHEVPVAPQQEPGRPVHERLPGPKYLAATHRTRCTDDAGAIAPDAMVVAVEQRQQAGVKHHELRPRSDASSVRGPDLVTGTADQDEVAVIAQHEPTGVVRCVVLARGPVHVAAAVRVPPLRPEVAIACVGRVAEVP